MLWFYKYFTAPVFVMCGSFYYKSYFGVIQAPKLHHLIYINTVLSHSGAIRFTRCLENCSNRLRLKITDWHQGKLCLDKHYCFCRRVEPLLPFWGFHLLSFILSLSWKTHVWTCVNALAGCEEGKQQRAAIHLLMDVDSVKRWCLIGWKVTPHGSNRSGCSYLSRRVYWLKREQMG